MQRTATRRGLLAGLVVVAAVVSGVPWASWCPAEPFEAFARTLRAPLRQQRIDKLVVVIAADESDGTGEPTPVEIESLRKQVAEVCRDLSIEATVIAPSDDHPRSSLLSAPDPADWQPLLKREKADAAVCLTWKTTRSGLAVRVSLVNDRKVAWNGRARLKRKSTAEGSALTGKMSGAGNGVGGGNVMGPMLAGSMGGWPAPAWDSTGSGGALNSTLSGQGAGANSSGTPLPGGNGSTGNGPSGGSGNLNAKILQFAKDHLGQQVGGGECYELPVVAFEAVGARPPTAGNNFGQEVALAELAPGDVLQFWSAKLVGRLGRWELGEPGHNAIVGEVRGSYVSIYHQNINGVRRVRLDVLDLGGLVSGQIIGYRAIAR